MGRASRNLKTNGIGKQEQFKDKSMTDLYFLAADKITIAFQQVYELIMALCDGNKQAFEEKAKEIQKTEQESDRYHDEIIARMFGRETLVFSRVDRIYLINELDNVVDTAESISRRAIIYFPNEIPAPLIGRFIAIAEKARLIATHLTNAIKGVFIDFNTVLPIIEEIEKLRHFARDDNQDFLQILYQYGDMPARDFMYYDRLIRQIKISIQTSNKFADGLRRLIFKYRI